MSTLSKRLRAIFCGIAYASISIFTFSSQANAVIVDTAGDEFTVVFDGIVNGSAQPGLTAEATFYLVSITDDGMGGQDWNFDITLSNTSSAPILDSRVSILAFNLADDYFRARSSVSGVFDTVGTGNMPMVGGVNACLKAAGSTKNCAGGGNGGVDMGDTGSISLSINYDTLLPQLEFTDFFVRYQSIDGSAFGSSGVGYGTAVPVPSAAWFLGTALVSLAGIGRSRKAA